MLIAFIQPFDTSGAIQGSVSAPAGWSQVDSEYDALNTHGEGLAAFAHQAGSSEPASYTFTSSASNQGYQAIIVAYSGADPTINAHAGLVSNSASSPIPIPGITSTAANCLWVGCGCSWSVTCSEAAPWTARVNPTGYGLGVADQTLATAGTQATDSTNFTATTPASPAVGFSVVLQPPVNNPAPAANGDQLILIL